MKDPIALFDMDGTLFDYDGQLRRDLVPLMGPGEELPDNLWDESKPWLKARMGLIKSVPGWWRDLPKLQAGWDVLEQARAVGFEPHIITKGPGSRSRAWCEKHQCIVRHFGDGVSVDIVGKDKSATYGRVLVEDYPPYLDGWLKHRPRGLGILIDNPNNRDFQHPNVIRYTGDNLLAVRTALKAAFDRRPNDHWQNQPAWCEFAHRDQHERFDEETGDCGYGPIWSSGIRCKACGREWPDPEKVEAERARWRAEQDRWCHIHVGTADRMFGCGMSLEWGSSEERFRDDYAGVREALQNQMDHTPYDMEPEPDEDIGPPEDKWYVFYDDLHGACDEVCKHSSEGASDGWDRRFTRELDLFANWPGHVVPMHPSAQKFWDLRKVGYAEAVARVARGK